MSTRENHAVVPQYPLSKLPKQTKSQAHNLLGKFGISYWATFLVFLYCMQTASVGLSPTLGLNQSATRWRSRIAWASQGLGSRYTGVPSLPFINFAPTGHFWVSFSKDHEGYAQ